MAAMPNTWDEARDALNISIEKVLELQAQGVEVKDLFYMLPEDLREHHLSSITRSRIAQIRAHTTNVSSQASREKEFTTGLAGVKSFSMEMLRHMRISSSSWSLSLKNPASD